MIPYQKPVQVFLGRDSYITEFESQSRLFLESNQVFIHPFIGLRTHLQLIPITDQFLVVALCLETWKTDSRVIFSPGSTRSRKYLHGQFSLFMLRAPPRGTRSPKGGRRRGCASAGLPTLRSHPPMHQRCKQPLFLACWVPTRSSRRTWHWNEPLFRSCPVE